MKRKIVFFGIRRKLRVLKTHTILALIIMFIVGNLNALFAGLTMNYTFTTGKDDQFPAKLNTNFETLRAMTDYGIPYDYIDTGALRFTNSLGTLPTSGDTDDYGCFLMGYYEDTSPAVAYTEDTITHNLGYTPIWVEFMPIADTNVIKAWTVRRTDTDIVWKAEGCTVPFRIRAH